MFFTLFLWFIIQLTKTYDYSSKVDLNIVNVPNHISIQTTNLSLDFVVEANGFKLWTYNLSKQKIDLDYELLEEKPKGLVINTDVIKSKLNEKEVFESKNFSFLKNSLTIPYTIKDSKKVPVISRVEYQFADGYNSLNELVIKPDSVVVTGSKKDLTKVSEIYTAKKKITRVNQDLEGNIALFNPFENVNLSEEVISYSLNVMKFSEKSLELKIDVINVPDSLNLSIYPQKAKLTFLVSLEDFDKITELDFKIICDYNKRYSEEAIMIPVLENVPDVIKNINLSTKKVDYLLVKN